MAGRRSPGEGSISQRKDGRWQASLQVNGQRTTVYGKTRAEAAAKLRILQRQAPAPVVNLTLGKRTLNDLLEAWLETKAPNLKPRTLADYRHTCERYLSPALGTMPLSKLTPERIERLLACYQDHPRTAQKLYLRLSQALALAVRWGWLASNPCERVDAPRYRVRRKELWAPEQLRTFLDQTRDHWLHPLWVLLSFSGIRLGEALALEWQDVDLAKGRIRIAKSVQRIEGQCVTSEPKTAAGVRGITLPGEVIEALQRQALARLAQGGGPLVFMGAKGDPLPATTVQGTMRRACKRLGLPPMTPHGLRHLHASILLAEGLPIPAVSQRLGHANSAVTMAIYAHAIGKDDSAATEAIERAIGTER